MFKPLENSPDINQLMARVRRAVDAFDIAADAHVAAHKQLEAATVERTNAQRELDHARDALLAFATGQPRETDWSSPLAIFASR